MKTILHISKYYYPYLGGIEFIAKSLAEGMNGYRNVVVCYSTTGKDSKETVNGITVYRVKVQFIFMSQAVSLGYYSLLRKLMKEYSPEYVHVHCPNPFVYPLVFKTINPQVKLVLHWHSDILSKGIVYDIIKPFEKAIMRRADRILTTSPDYIHPSSPVYEFREKTDVVPNGISVTDLKLQEKDGEIIAKIKEGLGGKGIVLFVGRHVPYKGLDLLIEAEKYLKSDCIIVIAGSGPLTKSLKQKAVSERFVFTGRLSTDELRCYYHAADVFAFPSINKAEAFGLAIVEAMYCRCVPVMFHIEGSGVNWVTQNTGMEVPMGDVKAFAQAIDVLLEDDGKRTLLGNACRERVEKEFTDEVATKKLENVYGRL